MNFENSSCSEKQIYFMKVCISNVDLIIICLNLLIITTLVMWIGFKSLLDKKKNKVYNVCIKNSFHLLGEGPLSCFYSTDHGQTKQNVTKKKNVSGKNLQDKFEKGSNSKLKCLQCGRTVELTYQHTIGKLIPS